jgi:hypothetical protein
LIESQFQIQSAIDKVPYIYISFFVLLLVGLVSFLRVQDGFLVLLDDGRVHVHVDGLPPAEEARHEEGVDDKGDHHDALDLERPSPAVLRTEK